MTKMGANAGACYIIDEYKDEILTSVMIFELIVMFLTSGKKTKNDIRDLQKGMKSILQHVDDDVDGTFGKLEDEAGAIDETFALETPKLNEEKTNRKRKANLTKTNARIPVEVKQEPKSS